MPRLTDELGHIPHGTAPGHGATGFFLDNKSKNYVGVGKSRKIDEESKVFQPNDCMCEEFVLVQVIVHVSFDPVFLTSQFYGQSLERDQWHRANEHMPRVLRKLHCKNTARQCAFK